MKFLEKDLEQIIYETPNEILRRRGLWISGQKKRQLNLGGYGRADIITLHRERGFCYSQMVYSIYELKKDCISVSSFFQALRYAKGIKRYLKTRYGNEHDMSNSMTFNITLIAPEIDLKSDVCHLPDVFNFLDGVFKLYTYKYDVDGITFHHVGDYNASNEGFVLPKKLIQ